MLIQHINAKHHLSAKHNHLLIFFIQTQVWEDSMLPASATRHDPEPESSICVVTVFQKVQLNTMHIPCGPPTRTFHEPFSPKSNI
jgi:hypothetical protein